MFLRQLPGRASHQSELERLLGAERFDGLTAFAPEIAQALCKPLLRTKHL